MKTMIVIPTYEEKENIQKLIEELFNINPYFYVTVVDDNSPDGTADIVKELQKKYPYLNLILRKEKKGLGTAYIEGFKFALRQNMDVIVQMDADLSHPPQYLPQMLLLLDEYDVVVGSRYIKGVRVNNWPFKRLLISKFANLYVKMITGMPFEDCTSGFKCIKRKVLETIDIETIESKGYVFQIELLFRMYTKGFKIVEYPIMFNEREGGKSKISRKIAREAFWKVLKLGIERFYDRKIKL